MLRPLLSLLIEDIKKDVKNEHLKNDILFCKQYLPGKNIAKATTADLADAYAAAMENSEYAEKIAEFLSQRWLLQNTDLYDFFEETLMKIDPNFTELEMLDSEISKKIVQEAIQTHGALNTYFFSVINSVVFPKEIYAELSRKAQDETTKKEEEAAKAQQQMTLENMQRHYEQQIARLTDKYEKKISGLQKKYVQDTENLKKQLAQLHKKSVKN